MSVRLLFVIIIIVAFYHVGAIAVRYYCCVCYLVPIATREKGARGACIVWDGGGDRYLRSIELHGGHLKK